MTVDVSKDRLFQSSDVHILFHERYLQHIAKDFSAWFLRSASKRFNNCWFRLQEV